MFEILPIDKISPAKDNVRRRIGDVRDLAASVASVGIVEPLLVSPAEEAGHYVVVAGHRRLEAVISRR
jgi:ParB family chromosome partitioning protein